MHPDGRSTFLNSQNASLNSQNASQSETPMSWMKRSVQLRIPMAFAVVLGSVFLGYLAYSYEEPTPRSVFDHSEFLLPLQGLATEKTFDMEFSVGYESYRYSVFFDFAPVDSSYDKPPRNEVLECFEGGTLRIEDGKDVVGETRRDRRHGVHDGVHGWYITEGPLPVVYLDSGIHLTPGRTYRLELKMPSFTERCQTFSPQLRVVVVPRPDL